jgi:hypothetical protein
MLVNLVALVLRLTLLRTPLLILTDSDPDPSSENVPDSFLMLIRQRSRPPFRLSKPTSGPASGR